MGFEMTGNARTTPNAPRLVLHDRRADFTLRFVDTFGNAPVLSLSASATYQIKPAISLFVSASYDKIFTVTGNTSTYNTSTGGAPTVSTNSAGLDFESAAIKIGIKGRF